MSNKWPPVTHTDLLLELKRVTFLLSSARLVLPDKESRRVAAEAVRDAQALIKRAEA